VAAPLDARPVCFRDVALATEPQASRFRLHFSLEQCPTSCACDAPGLCTPLPRLAGDRFLVTVGNEERKVSPVSFGTNTTTVGNEAEMELWERCGPALASENVVLVVDMSMSIDPDVMKRLLNDFLAMFFEAPSARKRVMVVVFAGGEDPYIITDAKCGNHGFCGEDDLHSGALHTVIDTIDNYRTRQDYDRATNVFGVVHRMLPTILERVQRDAEQESQGEIHYAATQAAQLVWTDLDHNTHGAETDRERWLAQMVLSINQYYHHVATYFVVSELPEWRQAAVGPGVVKQIGRYSAYITNNSKAKILPAGDAEGVRQAFGAGLGSASDLGASLYEMSVCPTHNSGESIPFTVKVRGREGKHRGTYHATGFSNTCPHETGSKRQAETGLCSRADRPCGYAPDGIDCGVCHQQLLPPETTATTQLLHIYAGLVEINHLDRFQTVTLTQTCGENQSRGQCSHTDAGAIAIIESDDGGAVRDEVKEGHNNNHNSTIGPLVLVGSTEDGKQMIHIRPRKNPVDTRCKVFLFLAPGRRVWKMQTETSPLALIPAKSMQDQDHHGCFGTFEWAEMSFESQWKDTRCIIWNAVILILCLIMVVLLVFCIRRSRSYPVHPDGLRQIDDTLAAMKANEAKEQKQLDSRRAELAKLKAEVANRVKAVEDGEKYMKDAKARIEEANKSMEDMEQQISQTEVRENEINEQQLKMRQQLATVMSLDKAENAKNRMAFRDASPLPPPHQCSSAAP
jgi:hypothetical protein